MTLQELAALPEGTKVKLDMRPDIGYDHGTIVRRGKTTYILWEPEIDGTTGATSIIHTEDEKWAAFVGDLSLDN